MSPVEDARALKKIMEYKGWSQAEVARDTCIHPTQVSQLLKYLNLSPPIQELLINGKISNGNALIVALYPQGSQQEILERILEERDRLGGKIEQNVALRIAKMVAEEKGVAPHRRRTKDGGRKVLCHADAVAKNVLSKAGHFKKALEELSSAGKASGGLAKFLKSLKEVNVLEVEECLKELEKTLRKIKQDISDFA